MQGKELSVRRMEGIGERSVTGTFAALLSLTSDAVIAFDGAGRILLANDEASRLLRSPGGSLVGVDVRMLFPPAGDSVPGTASSAAAEASEDVDDRRVASGLVGLPFSTDGEASSHVCLGADGSPVEVEVRCDKVRAPGETYLLVAHALREGDAARRDNERLVEELSRSNKRLSGTLRIVLSTLDSEDVSTLFQRVLNEIATTMEAHGAIMYLAEPDGFRLRGSSDAVPASSAPRFMPYGRTIETLATREGRTLRLRVRPPQRDQLRRGAVRTREVVDEETREIHKVRSNMLPPFQSFLVVPVWFGGHVISIIEVGWHEVHPLSREDARLLDAVAEYLSVQLVGAFASLRARETERLESLLTMVRERLLGLRDVTPDEVGEAMAYVANELRASCVTVAERGKSKELVCALPEGEERLPMGLSGLGLEGGGTSTMARSLSELPELASWAEDRAGSGVGALVCVGAVDGQRCSYLLLRDPDDEPLVDVELDFLEHLADDIQDIEQGDEARASDKRIAQALQSGMRNELQQVDGITSQGLYSSATAAAFVGGDFYDLIRLPDRRACVIMGDVSGSGVEAASVSAAVKTALGAYAWEGLSPARMVRSLNDFLLGFSRIETFATLFVGVVDLARSRITYCSAGHPPAILMRARTNEIQYLGVQSGVVGAFHDMHYQDGVERLEEGDAILLYTDGTTEARAQDGTFFGEDGLSDALVREVPRGFDGLCQRLLSTLDDFTGNSLEDDVAMVALRFDSVGEKDEGEKDD